MTTIALYIYTYYSGRELTPTGGCDENRISNQIGQIAKMLNSTLFDRLNTFWPSQGISNNE
jgi:ribonuclease T2